MNGNLLIGAWRLSNKPTDVIEVQGGKTEGATHSGPNVTLSLSQGENYGVFGEALWRGRLAYK